MKLVEITSKEFDLLVKAEPFASFYQSSDYADYLKSKNSIPIYIKYVNSLGNCVSLSMFLLKKEALITSRYTAYAPFGFLTNFYDEDELVAFNDELKAFLKTKKVNKIVISPNLKMDEHINNSLTHMGYKRINDKYLYKIDVSGNDLKKFNKNLIFRFKQVDESNTNFDHILLNYENEEIYKAFNKTADLYINQLDSSRSLHNLNESLKDNEKFIQRHKSDPKYETKIEHKLEDIKEIKKLISRINKIEKILGEDPILCLALVHKYNDEYYLLFLENKDEKEVFDSQNYLVNKLMNEAYEKGYQQLIALNSFPKADRVELIGEYYLNI